MVLSAALMAVSMFLYVSITTIKASVGLNALEYSKHSRTLKIKMQIF